MNRGASLFPDAKFQRGGVNLQNSSKENYCCECMLVSSAQSSEAQKHAEPNPPALRLIREHTEFQRVIR
jgi:hypothetical protein